LPSDDDDFNIFEILKAVPVISTLTAMELEELAKKLKPRKFAKDEYMMQFGEDGNEFFIIISGVCKVLNKEGHQVAELGSGDFVGEMALLEKKPRNATVLCVENCETLVADKPLFESVLGENSSVRFAKRHAKRNAVLTVYKDEEEEKVDVVQRINPDAEIEWISECVSDNILFVNLESRSKLDIIKKMYLEEVEENYDLIKQKAEKADTFYVIKEGSFAVIINGMRVSKLVKGECFGELALMHDAPRAATIRAIEKSKVWTLERSNFRRAVTDAKKKMRKQRLGWLKEVELFKCLSETQLHDVDDALEEMVYSRDQVILREGAVGDRFYIVKSGCVKWETSHGETGERSKGEYFGERALINNQTRAATVTARVQSVCLELNKRDFEALLGTVYDNMKKNIEIEIAASQTFMKQQSLAKDSMLRDDILDVRYSGTKLEDLETVGILGRGAFGVVTLVIDPLTDKSYALKAIKKCQIVEMGQQSHIVNEKRVMERLNNQFLVNLRGTFKDELRVYFLLDVCLGGELFTILRRARYFDEETSKFYAACVVEAFAYMHGIDIVYRDLKPENLVLDSTGYLKVTDFGFAKRIDDKTYTLCGTPDYLAPEIVTGVGHCMGVDWWTLGILIFEMLSSLPPFYGDTPIETYKKIVQCRLRFPRYLSHESKEIIRGFLKAKVTRRLGVTNNRSVSMIRNHEWFHGFSWRDLADFKLRPPLVPKLKSQSDMSNFNTLEKEFENAYPVSPEDDFDDEF